MLLVVLVILLSAFALWNSKHQEMQIQQLEQNMNKGASQVVQQTPTAPIVQSEDSAVDTSAWQTYSQNTVEDQDDPSAATTYAFSLKYPANWILNKKSAGGDFVPYNFIVSQNPVANTMDRSSACVQVSDWLDGPIRTDNPDAQTALTNQGINLDINRGQVLSTKNITVNGLPAIERQILAVNETQPTTIVEIAGGQNNINYRFPGTFATVYTLAACQNTPPDIFNAIVNSFTISH